MLKIKIIFDNNKDNENLQEGFGFSCLVEFENQKILFDTGGSRTRFLGNIEKLDIKLKEVTNVVFSHKHFDHIAGIEEILSKVPDTTAIYLPYLFPDNIREKIPVKLNINVVESFKEIERNIYLLMLPGEYLSSKIYEQSLILDTTKGLVVITGCAHPGIVNILKTIKTKFPNKKIHIAMGGFHLFQSWFWVSSKAVKQIKALGIEKVAPGHCTGNRASKQLQKIYKENFIRIGTGTVIEV